MPFRKRTTTMQWNEKGRTCLLCCRFPYSSRPMSLGGVGNDHVSHAVNHFSDTKEHQFAHDHDSCSSPPLFDDEEETPGAPHNDDKDSFLPPDSSSTSLMMNRKKLKPSIARQVATIATSRAHEVAGLFTPEVRQAALQKVAKVEREEINRGHLLGVGSFSLVHSIESINFDIASCNDFYSKEQLNTQTRLIFLCHSRSYSEDKQSCRRRLSQVQGTTSSPPLYASERSLRPDEKPPKHSNECADVFRQSHSYTEDQQSMRRRLTQGTNAAAPPLHDSEMILTSDEEPRKHSNQCAETSRGDIMNHCKGPRQRQVVAGRGKMKSMSAGPSTTIQGHYAIKHLKPELLNFPEKFGKAAIDLACEAEFLLCLDHPHIVKLHGWPTLGPKVYRCGEHDSFFLVIDRMVETLHDRVYAWRDMILQNHDASLVPSKKEFKSHTVRTKVPHFLLWLLFSCQSSHQCRSSSSESSVDSHGRQDALFLERIRVACDIASAIQHIHDRRIIHRDIKTTNIGFDLHGVVKVFDFGLARHLPSSSSFQSDDSFQMSNVGTKRYCAPEVSKKQYNLKADVYSFGVVLWEMLTLNTPQKPPRQSAVSGTLLDTQKLRSCPCWPLAIQRLVSQMQNHDYRQRPTITSVRMTLSSFLPTIGDPPPHAMIKGDGDSDETALRRGRSYRKGSTSVHNSSTISDDERFKLRASRSASALIEDQETALSSSLMGMSISATQPQ